MSNVPEVIVLAGPTAVGKTAIAQQVCRQIGGAIVGCDSRQVYRYLDIGTAKPTAAELGPVQHYLLDVAGPGETYHVQRYYDDATATINYLLKKQIVPVVTVGTGMFFEALQYNLISTPVVSKEMRHRALSAVSNNRDQVYEILQHVDPLAAINKGDTQRLVRWYEVYLETGKSMRCYFSKRLSKPRFSALNFTLERSRQELYQRINSRVELMLQQGLVEEISKAMQVGYDFTKVPVVGYSEFMPFINGRATLMECAEEVKKHSRRYAKRQMTWFRNRLRFPALQLGTSCMSEEAAVAHIVMCWSNRNDLS
ncbi:tRNA (adenosine(37)-N6)-dimethylallyltransferase MiaA [Desulfurispira natronophila]|uniref:tRNA dimethylallyltransferase n=1 Tax=Desulfurispira natronophila TaxID=682562 RepID=A0A7W7Y3I0_9BACT|nr:tRNA dimethylallyltransferase [Desulfurispira natronophila]